MRARIMLVEDDDSVAALVREYLEALGFEVEVFSNGDDAAEAWLTLAPDLIILDWMLPGVSGIDICRAVRGQSSIPVIMLTARGHEVDKLLGLELGADDYITKPFSPRELVARVRAVLRRVESTTTQNDDLICLGNIRIDTKNFMVQCLGETVPLTRTEFLLLATMAKYPNRVFSRLQLMESVFNEYFEGYERSVDSHISRIRRKLADICQGSEDVVTTVHGVGYKVVPPR